MRAEAFAVRLYRAATRLAPPGFRASASPAAADLFARMWAERRGRRRWALVGAAYPRLAAVLWVEWWEELARHIGARAIGTRGGGEMGDWMRTLRHGVRSLRRAPGFTLTVVLLMGLGVGSVVTIFTVVDHLLLRPLPYPESRDLVYVDRGSYSYPVVRDLEQLGSVSEWAVASPGTGTLVGEGDPLVVTTVRVNPAFFHVFGATPELGRLLLPDDFREGGPAVLGAGAWRRIWGSDPSIVGRTIRVDGRAVTVVGVLDPSFQPPEATVGRTADIWLPVDPAAEQSNSRNYFDFGVAGRLSAGATIETAAAEVDALARRLAAEYPDWYVDSDGTYHTMPVVTLAQATVGDARRPVLLLLGGAALLLLIACVNVAHLVLARGLARAREFAVRRAIGAGSGAVTRQLLGEALLLGLGGGVAGGVLAAGAVRALHAWAPVDIPRLAEVTVDPRALLFALAVAVVTAVAFGVAPALMASRRSVATTLRRGDRTSTSGRGANRLRGGLVVAELALSLVLVIQAGLLVRSLGALGRVEAGFRVEGLWTAQLPLGSIRRGQDDPTRLERIRDAVAGVPGVREVTYGLTLPLEWSNGPRCCRIVFSSTPVGGDGRTLTWLHPVRHDYFDVLGVRILEGAAWERDEDEGGAAKPVVVNESLARALFGTTEGVVGREFAVEESQAIVVGLAAEVHQFGLDLPQPPSMYTVPDNMNRASIAFRADPGVDVGRAVREAVWSVEPDLPVPTVEAMQEIERRSMTGPRFDSLLVGTFGVVALLLAAGGLSGTLFYLVGERRREIGIRMTLGAGAGQLERSVVRRGLTWAGAGIGLGLGGGIAVARLIQDRLFQVEGTDPATLVVTAGLLTAVAVLASWLPARRAARTDPLETLRAD